MPEVSIHCLEEPCLSPRSLGIFDLSEVEITLESYSGLAARKGHIK